MAARIHDSVLQTLALIQRQAEDPAKVIQLARLQERELRSWLFEGRGLDEIEGDATLTAGSGRSSRTSSRGTVCRWKRSRSASATWTRT